MQQLLCAENVWISTKKKYRIKPDEKLRPPVNHMLLHKKGWINVYSTIFFSMRLCWMRYTRYYALRHGYGKNIETKYQDVLQSEACVWKWDGGQNIEKVIRWQKSQLYINIRGIGIADLYLMHPFRDPNVWHEEILTNKYLCTFHCTVVRSGVLHESYFQCKFAAIEWFLIG